MCGAAVQGHTHAGPANGCAPGAGATSTNGESRSLSASSATAPCVALPPPSLESCLPCCTGTYEYRETQEAGSGQHLCMPVPPESTGDYQGCWGLGRSQKEILRMYRCWPAEWISFSSPRTATVLLEGWLAVACCVHPPSTTILCAHHKSAQPQILQRPCKSCSVYCRPVIPSGRS